MPTGNEEGDTLPDCGLMGGLRIVKKIDAKTYVMPMTVPRHLNRSLNGRLNQWHRLT